MKRARFLNMEMKLFKEIFDVVERFKDELKDLEHT